MSSEVAVPWGHAPPPAEASILAMQGAAKLIHRNFNLLSTRKRMAPAILDIKKYFLHASSPSQPPISIDL